MTIIFYDFPSERVGSPWSPSTWRVRYALNIKGLPYETEWIEYGEIEALYSKFGMSPTSTNLDGSPRYTLPVIHDPSTGVYISDSANIVDYLEETYPTCKSLYPSGTNRLQKVFVGAFEAAIFVPSTRRFMLPATYSILNQQSKGFFRRTKEKSFGDSLENMVPKGDLEEAWQKFEGAFAKIDSWYSYRGAVGPFLMGNIVSWGDVVIAAYLMYLKCVLGEESQEWRNISSWNGGRWGKLLEEFRKYETLN